MTIWRYERDVENIRIVIARLEQIISQKQDEFQRATRRGEEAEARLLRREQLQYEEQLRDIIRELIHAERKLAEVKETQEHLETKIAWW